MALSNQTSTLVRFGYDAASRLKSVTNGTATATYSYLANSPLVSEIDFANNGSQMMAVSKSYDNLNRVTSVSAGSTVSFNYGYNAANQRTAMTNVDNSYWAYGYDSLGQVTAGTKRWGDGSLQAGQQFLYAFDEIGNRMMTAAGGDQWGANLRYASYAVNSVNQYTSRTVPGAVDVIGTANASATVTVNNQPASRKGTYYDVPVVFDNSTSAVWASLTNLAVLHNGTNLDITTNFVANLFLPQTPESFSYDADGNLTQDGRWTYGWDAENRLTNMTSLSTASTASKLQLDFVYDSQGRRIQKIVSTNNGSAYYPQSTNRFVYDGWNLIAVLNPQAAVVRSFVWGLDLSGSPQGAGGVGGLLEINDAANGIQFAASDGNGNVAALVKGTDGTASAQYEYGPFGEVIRATGPMARANPLRFSTKYQDDETDLFYYGYRYYNASTGRWLSRDPYFDLAFRDNAVQELPDGDPDLNEYTLVANDPVIRFDVNGLIGPRRPGQKKGGEPYNPPNLNKPCCKCERHPCNITATVRDSGSTHTTFRIHLDLHHEGCCPDLQILWTTCYRSDGYGILDECTDSTDCTFRHNSPRTGNGSWELGIFIRYLTCKGGKFVPGPQILLGLNCHRIWGPLGGTWVCN
ncbi:MAG: RHS repeat-associated core domain-containing protein [Verrucomicrobia bacterium]|nr:RHS repeat-associated core domain-containing protein [Verrucomicrobiota bacterium]